MTQDTGANHPVSPVLAGTTSNKDRTLLIADDDAAFRNRIARALELRGFIVTSVGSVAEALAQTARPPAFATDGVLAQRLKAVVEDAVSRGVTRRVGVAVYDLATGQGTGIHDSEVFRPASVIKLGVLVAAYQARPHMVGAQFNRLRPDLERMITLSNNAATRRLVKRLGARSVNAAVRELGLHQFRVGESGSQEWVLRGSKAAPGDTALLLAKIARREVVSRDAGAARGTAVARSHSRRPAPGAGSLGREQDRHLEWRRQRRRHRPGAPEGHRLYSGDLYRRHPVGGGRRRIAGRPIGGGLWLHGHAPPGMMR